MSTHIIQPLNLVEGLNINPIPLEFSQGITTTKWLLAMQAKINEAVLISNEAMAENTAYTDEKYNVVAQEINNLISSLNNGDIIPDGSIGLEKLKADFSAQFIDSIADTVRDVAKFVTFGLNDNGNFIAIIPSSWDNIVFGTDTDGNLILNY